MERDTWAAACTGVAGAAELALGDAARAAAAGHLAAVMSDVRAAFAAATVDVQCLRAECDGLAEDLARGAVDVARRGGDSS